MDITKGCMRGATYRFRGQAIVRTWQGHEYLVRPLSSEWAAATERLLGPGR